MTGACMLGRDSATDATSSGALSSLLSLCRESFVTELSVHMLVRQPCAMNRKHSRVESTDVFELLENISSGSVPC
jgi:hypothetical protein